jgi:hypothetical protein
MTQAISHKTGAGFIAYHLISPSEDRGAGPGMGARHRRAKLTASPAGGEYPLCTIRSYLCHLASFGHISTKSGRRIAN